MPRTSRPVGAHIQLTGGLATGGLSYADQVDAGAVQVFVANPRGWALPTGDPSQDERFVEGCQQRGIPVHVHAPYLINLGSPDDATREKSIASLRHSLRRGRAIGASGVVVHAGSAVGTGYDAGIARTRQALAPVLDELDDADPRVLVEGTAGGGQALAATITQLGAYLHANDDHPKLGVCLDTAHLFAAGHDLAARSGMTRMLDEAAELIGADRIGLIHVNDSAAPCGSKRDRHANIGSGEIGAAPFTALRRHRVTAGVTMVVETPGGADGHARDIATLRGRTQIG